MQQLQGGHRVDPDHIQLNGVDIVGHDDDVGGVGDQMGGPGAVAVGRQEQDPRADQRWSPWSSPTTTSPRSVWFEAPKPLVACGMLP
ncbi:MAG TPA: hypothetical protein VMU34_22695 [Mycobacterium sp.]|nr:hypothetical protein [Mycobacterium sp.]